MKTIKTIAITVFAIFIICYMYVAFTTLEVDFREWAQETRGVLLAIFSVLSLAAIGRIFHDI
jgi:uncharacterized membrane protein